MQPELSLTMSQVIKGKMCSKKDFYLNICATEQFHVCFSSVLTLGNILAIAGFLTVMLVSWAQAYLESISNFSGWGFPRFHFRGHLEVRAPLLGRMPSKSSGQVRGPASLRPPRLGISISSSSVT